MINLLDVLPIFKSVWYVILALIILLIMITVHEFGHYIVGKIFKFKINEFSIGMGPALFQKDLKSGEKFSVRLLPLGGYCAFEGEDDDNADENAFNNKKPWQRILVLFAGAFMNYLLALLIIILSFSIYGQTVLGVQFSVRNGETEYILDDGDYILSIETERKKTNVYMTTDLISALNHSKKGDEVTVETVDANGKITKKKVVLLKDVECNNLTEIEKTFDALGIGSAMQIEAIKNNGFHTGDFIMRVSLHGEEYKDATFVYTMKDLKDLLSDSQVGDKVDFHLSSGEKRVVLPIILGEEWESVDKTSEIAVAEYFGIVENSRAYYTQSSYIRIGFFKTLGHSLEYSVKIGGTIFRSLGELITGKIGLNAVGGTVTTIATASKIISYGFVFALEIMAFIGVNLAVVNLLPIPALDGSRIVFCIIEWIRKKPLNRKVEGIIHTIGFILIFGFAILVDVLQFI